MDVAEFKRSVVSLHNSSDHEICLYILTQMQEQLKEIHHYPSSASQILEVAFSDKNGIMGFVRRNVGQKIFDKGKETAYAIITGLICNAKLDKNLALKYGLKFKDVINFSWKNARESARVQNAALEGLASLLQHYGSYISAMDLEACDLYRTLLVSSEKSAYVSSVRGNMLNLLGLLAFNYKDKVLDKALVRDQLLNHLISIIRKQVESKVAALEATVLLGAIRAVDQFLKVYGKNYCGSLQQLYDSLEKIVNPKISITFDAEEASLKINRREFQRATLTLIANHGIIFKENLYKKHKQWFEDLIAWARSKNADDYTVGKKATFSFIKAICECLNEVDGETSSLRQAVISSRKMYFQYLTTKFLEILDNKKVTKTDLLISIQGIGLIFTVSLEPQLKDQLLSKVFSQVDNLIGDLNTWQYSRESYGTLHSIATFLDCIGQILLSVELPDEAARKKFEVRLLSTEQLSVLWLKYYANLNKKFKEETETSFLKVIRNIYSQHNSHFHAFVENVFSEALTAMIAAPTKLENKVREQDKTDQIEIENEPEKKKIFEVTASSYFQCWISLINSSTESEDPSSLTSYLYDACIQWALSTINKLDLSLTYFDDDDPIVEGDDDISDPVYTMNANVPRDFQLFVNLVDFLQSFIPKTDLTLILKWIPTFVSDVTAYVSKCSFISGFYKIMATIFSAIKDTSYFQNEAGSQNDTDTVDVCSTFLMSLGIKAKEFRDNLLLCVLEVWLSAPDELILKVLYSLPTVLHSVFSIGQNYLPFALQGVSAMERWLDIETIPVKFKEDLYCNLFPVWMQYFSTQVQSKDNELNTDQVSLESVQSRLLLLIGSSGHLYKVDETSLEAESPQMVAEEKLLKYSVPFHDMKPDLYLDNLLPRILELCNTGSDRQVRTSACECFHTLILYFLGYSTNSIASGKHEELFQRIFSQVMKLGCDSDLLIRQLFNPLAVQMVHFYTSKTQSYDSALLQIIVDGLTQSKNAPLRDFSGVCIGEYFLWSLKSRDFIKGSKMDQVMKTVCALSTHAAPNYRQASVLAFNCIYREFREDEGLINRYTFQLIHAFLVSLCLPSQYGSDSILIKSTRQSIRHLERIILKKKDYFNTAMRDRKYPADVTGACLRDMVDWIFKKAGDSKTNYGREECLRLVSVFASAIRGITSAQQYLESLEASITADRILDLIEAKVITVHKSHKSLSKARAVEELLTWIPYLEETLDLYRFLSGAGYPIERILLLPRSKFIRSIDELLQRVPFDRFSSSFILGVGRILSDSDFSNLFSFRTEHIFLISSIRESAKIKFYPNLADLVKTWEALWDGNTQHDECRTEFLKLADFQMPDTDSDRNVTRKGAILTLSIVEWLRVIGSTSFLRKILTEDDVRGVTDKCWNFIERQLFYRGQNNRLESVHPPLHVEKLLQGMMAQIVQLDQTSGDYLERVFDSEEVTLVQGKLDEKITKGDVFQNIMLPGLLNAEKIFDFREMTFRVKLEKVGIFITKLVQLVKQRKAFREKYANTLVTNVISIWQQIQLNFEPEIVSRILTGLISLDAERSRNSKDLCKWWSDMMTSTQKTIQEKSNFIEFLYFFGMSSALDVQNLLFKTIEKLSNHDWIKDWELDEVLVSKVFESVLSLYRKFPGNLNLLSSVTTFFMKIIVAIEAYHDVCHEQCSATCIHYSCFLKIQKLLVTIATSKSTSESLSLSIVENIYNLIQNGVSVASLSLQKFCLIPCLAYLQERPARTFFVHHISDILKSAGTTPNTYGEWLSKTAALGLIETLALKTSMEFLKGAELNNAYISNLPNPPATPDGKELLKELLKPWMAMKNATFTPDEANVRTRSIQFSCMAAGYNSASAILAAAKCEERFYTGLLFIERKEQMIWDKIMDCNTELYFPVVPEFIPESSSQESATGSIPNAVPFPDITMNKLPAFGLEGSSLAMEATQFDFSFFGELNDAGNSPDFGDNNQSEDSNTRLLRMSSHANNPINNHESMMPLVQTVRHLQKLAGRNESMADWMKWILEKLERQTTPINIKLFISGLVMNCEDVFRKFAPQFLEPLLGVIFEGHCRNPPTETSNSVNFFEKDLLVMLLGWKGLATPTVIAAEKIFNYFLRKVEYSRSDVTKHNLEFLTEIIKTWIQTGFTPLTHSTILGVFDKLDPPLALNVVKHIIEGGVLPGAEENLPLFITKVSKFIQSSQKRQFQIAAEVMGLLLKRCKEMEIDHFSNIVSHFRKYLVSEKGRVQPFVTMLSAISLNYPRLVVTFKRDILGVLKNKVEIRREAMDLLLVALKQELESITDPIERNRLTLELFLDLEGRSMFKIECSDDYECDTGLKLLSMFLETNFAKDYEKLNQLVQWVNKAEESPDAKIRLAYATVLSTIYPMVVELQHDSKSELLHKIEVVFIRMYKSDDEAVNGVAYTFWAKTLENWMKSPNLLLELLRKFADDQQCVSVILDLMIKRCSMSPDFAKFLFDEPLSDAPYQEYKIDTSWNIQNSTLQPLFADSFSQSVSKPSSTGYSSIMSQRRGPTLQCMNLIRATLRKNFSLTQAGSETENMHNGIELMDTGEPSMPQLQQGFSLSETESKATFYSNPLSSLRRRFYSRKEYSQSAPRERQFFRIPDSRKQKKTIASRPPRNDVKLVRTYKIGELPDILFKHSELLLSITSLAKVDIQFGKAFLALLCIGTLDEMNQADAPEVFVEDVRSTFETILQKGNLLNRFMVSIILEVSTKRNIPVQPYLVSAAAINSKLTTSGILKLEHELITQVARTQPTAAKRARYNEHVQEGADIWLRIAQLYKDIHEFDTMRNIFSHLGSNVGNLEAAQYENARQALYNDSIGNYCVAANMYNDLYVGEVERSEPSALKLQLWSDGVHHALASLSKWSDCYETSSAVTDKIRAMGVQNDFKELMESSISKQLLSGVQDMIRLPYGEELKQKAETLKTFFNQRREDLELRGEKIALNAVLISFVEGNLDNISVCLKKILKTLNSYFQHIQELSRTEREEIISELRRTAAMFDVLEFSNTISMPVTEVDFVGATEKLVRKWRQSNSTINTRIKHADILVAERNFLLDKICEDLLPGDVTRNNGRLIEEIVDLKFCNDLWVVEVAAVHRNNYVGNDYLVKSKDLKVEKEKSVINWKRHYSKLLVACDISTYSEDGWARQWTTCWKKTTGTTVVPPDIIEIQADLLQNLVSTCCSRQVLKETYAILMKRVQVTSNRDLVPAVKTWMSSAISSAIQLKSSNTYAVNLSSDGSMKMFHLLKLMKSKFPDDFENDGKFHKNLLLLLLHGMKLQHIESSKFFPICFQILEKFPALGEIFSETVSQVDAWLFLPWLDQIMTTHKYKPELKTCLEPIIQKIFLKYPDAFQLQHTKINEIPNFQLPTVMESYEKALSALILPHIMFRQEINWRQVHQIPNFKEFLTNFVKKLETVKLETNFYGLIHQIFVNEIQPKLVEALKPFPDFEVPLEEQQNILTHIAPAINVAVNQLLMKRIEDGNNLKLLNLKDLSPWLYKFHFSVFKEALQVPGRNYDFEKPSTGITEKRIVSFDSVVQPYKSKTMPLRLTMVANDGQKYHFIAKYGDDLRQDKRIQQLFRFSNSILKESPECRKRDLKILTYSVIPITEEFGLIQRISKARSLYQYIFKSRTSEELYLNKSRESYRKWISSEPPGRIQPYHMYGKVATRKRRDVESGFDAVVKEVPSNIFQSNVLSSVDCFEKYFSVRTRLIRSLATMSLVHWILGIGDRHLENCMISLQSGEFLGIDFGYAFGFGVSLHVPELIPFRLTPQLQSLLEPYGVHGLFKEVMLCTLRSLAQSSEFLLSAAEVFVMEPAADWSRHKVKGAESADLAAKDAKKRLRIFEEKLNGRNPVHVLEELLKSQTDIMSQYIPQWIKVLKDNRGELGTKITVSDDETVDLLLSLATDPNILGRAWIGWSSWV